MSLKQRGGCVVRKEMIDWLVELILCGFIAA